MLERPKKREDLLLKEVEEELILYDPRSGESFLLNGTAAVVFQLCDGQTPVSSIAREIVSVLSAPSETVLADVQRVVKELAEKGLVEEGDDD
jgi:hypothetical protein